MVDLHRLPHELLYVGLLFALFVVPKLLQRFRLPSAITSFVLGAGAGLGLGIFHHDDTIQMLSTFGIVGLFLFAGLEVDVRLLRRNLAAIVTHLILRFLVLTGGMLAVQALLRLDPRAAGLVSLALFTPSTGFILGSLDTFGLDEDQKFSVKSMAIAAEILALFLLFVVLQSTTAAQLAVSTGAMLALIVFLPLIFWAFARWVAPHAPKSEFAFLLMLGVVCAFVTRRLGVYYLVGAFLVGMAAQAFRRRLPAVASDRMLFAVEVFASFFAPFYFFNAGLHLDRGDIVPEALFVGLVFVAVAVPINYLLVALPRRPASMSLLKMSRTSVAMLPTLVFTLVLAAILRDRFGVSPSIFGGLIVYTVVTTLIPGFFLGGTPGGWDEPILEDLEEPGAATAREAAGRSA
jgi:Kef-type K+ transport system membrane component KefB